MRFGVLATVCAGMFTGAATYVNLVEHPARMKGGPAAALAEWRPSYRRGTRMQAPLAVIAGLTAIATAFTRTPRAPWITGGLLMGSIVPFTLLVVAPTNHALEAPAAENDLARVQELLTRWNRLHAVRSLCGAAAFLSFAILLDNADRPLDA